MGEPRVGKGEAAFGGDAGAHRGAQTAIDGVGLAIVAMLDELSGQDRAALVRDRRKKFLEMGSRGLAA